MNEQDSKSTSQDFEPRKFRDALEAELHSGSQTVDRLLSKLEREPNGSHQQSATDAKLPRYELGKFVARGGMGAIYDVVDRDVNRSVAMKVMLAGSTATANQIGRFINEARITGQLEHPNIVPVHELGVSARGTVFYTMKYVRGMTLKEIIKGISEGDAQMIRRHPLNSLLTIFQKTCDAIAFAHSKGVIHRDLKPDNIMIGDYGEVLVLDWGLAKLVDKITDESLTVEVMRHMEAALDQVSSQEPQRLQQANGDLDTGGSHLVKPAAAIAGTPTYMAPEQTLDDPDRIDGRADVYALGGILYTILTLDVPIQAGTMDDLINLKREGQIDPPTRYNKSENGPPLKLCHLPGNRVPHALSAIAMKALSTRPEDRYRSIAELQGDLAAYQGGYATMAERAGSLRVIWLLIRRRWRQAATAAAAFALVASFILVFAASQMHYARKQKELYEGQKRIYEDLVRATEEREQISRQAAPEFLNKARLLVREQDWQGALRAIQVAKTLNPRLAEARVTEGRLLIALRSFEKASAVLAGIDPKDLTSQALADYQVYRELAESYGHESTRNAGRLPYPERFELAARFREMPDRPCARMIYRECIQDALKEGNLKAAIDAAVLLTEMENRTTSRLRYITLLEGDRIELDLSANPELTDLGPLEGLPLTRLSLADCPSLVNVDALRHMPLQELDLSNTGILDLKPLQNLKLARLELNNTKVQDFSPLKTLPLRHVSLRGALIQDLSEIQDLPLVRLDLSLCRNVSDLAPLARMIRLQELIIEKTDVHDLRPLQGLRLRLLNLNRTRVRDLGPLRSIPSLRQLHLDETGVEDLSPLTILNLQELSLYGSQVANLNPLGGMPLERLDLGKCHRVRDVRVLSTCRRLTHLRIPQQAQNIHELKELRNLKFLSYENASETAAEFWSRYRQ